SGAKCARRTQLFFCAGSFGGGNGARVVQNGRAQHNALYPRAVRGALRRKNRVLATKCKRTGRKPSSICGGVKPVRLFLQQERATFDTNLQLGRSARAV